MNIIQLQIIIIAILTSIACVVPGMFLMLRGVALMSDAISHAILPGIVIMFLIVGNLSSPLFIVGAATAGLLTVLATELLIDTKNLHKDAAIGLVFPLFFSIGVLLISHYARNVHLDLDMVLLGELAFAPFNRLIIDGSDYGPHALWSMGGVAALNLILVAAFFKELVLTTFDATFADIIGFSPTCVYYGLMIITSITAVSAFNVVGSTVVVALMLVPPATAYLLTYQVIPMLILSMALGITAVISGYTLAHLADLSIAGSIATMSGILFIVTWICAPYKGLMAHLLFNQSHKNRLALNIVCKQLAAEPMSITLLMHRLNWSMPTTHKILVTGLKEGYLSRQLDLYQLTEPGNHYLRSITSNLRTKEQQCHYFDGL